MFKIIIASLISVLLIFSSSDVNARTMCGNYYPSYGLLTAVSNYDNNAYYRLNYGGVLLAAIFAPTIIVPVYVLGFDLMTPVALRSRCVYGKRKY
jgi:hypothetical protein